MQLIHHNIAAGAGLYDFRPDKSSKVLIIINYFAVQRNVRRRRIVTAGEALAPRARGEEHGAPRPAGADICAVRGRGKWGKV